MSQKINPISVKLGLSRLWDTNFPKYGKSFKCYTKLLHKQFKIFIYLNRFLLLNNFLVENISVRFTHFHVIISIVMVNVNPLTSIPNINILSKTVYYWLKTPVIISFYKNVNLTNSSFLISNYASYLALQGIPCKKLLQSIYKILKDQSVKFKLIQTTQGINKIVLKGFKLKLTGCFEMSRSQMSKTIKCNFGSLPLTNLKGYIEYSNSTLYTKFGSCGLKVWLFYELKSL